MGENPEMWEHVTACGEDCRRCGKWPDHCPGCAAADGKVREWKESGICRIYACVKEHQALFCGLCREFPCRKLPALMPWKGDPVQEMKSLRRAYLLENHERGKIHEVLENRRAYLPLLLLADEQEDMIDRYLDRGAMYVLSENGPRAECVVTDEGNGILEIKNIAVKPEFQNMGYGKQLLDFLEAFYSPDFEILQVGTGDSPLTVPFYERCGFVRHHIVRDFFMAYDHPIYECGVQLRDMVYLRKRIAHRELAGKENRDGTEIF